MNFRWRQHFFTVYSIIIILLIYRHLTSPSRLSAADFTYLYQPGDAASKENYSVECQSEQERKMSFPPERVHKAILHKGFFSIDKTLSDSSTKRILEILNDSSSYVWGEVGTFEEKRSIVFYNDEGDPIGLTELEDSGPYTYSHPYLKLMKWGTLNPEASQLFVRLLEE